MYGGAIPGVGGVQEMFKIDVDTLVKANALTALLRESPGTVIFLLESAVAAYNNDAPYAAYPNHYGYRKVYHPSALEHKCYLVNSLTPSSLASFMASIGDAAAVVASLQRCTQDSDMLSVFPPVNPIEFQQLLYFTVFTCELGRELEDDWYQEMKANKEQGLTIYRMPEKTERDKEFAANRASATFLFHGTNFANAYCILRHGIKQIRANGIYMSSIIDIPLQYAANHAGSTGVVFCFQVRNHEARVAEGGGVYVMPEADVCLRAVLLLNPKPVVNHSRPVGPPNMGYYAVHGTHSMWGPKLLKTMQLPPVRREPEVVDLTAPEMVDLTVDNERGPPECLGDKKQKKVNKSRISKSLIRAYFKWY